MIIRTDILNDHFLKSLPHYCQNLVCICEDSVKTGYFYIDQDNIYKEDFVLDIFNNCKDVQNASILEKWILDEVEPLYLLLKAGGNTSFDSAKKKQKLIKLVKDFENYIMLESETFTGGIRLNY